MHDSRHWRSVRGLTATLAQTGFRKKEISVSKHGDLCDGDCLSRAHLRWFLRGHYYESGSVPPHLLRDPQPGDFAILTPPPSKSDPFDVVWGDKPIWLPFSADVLSAFVHLAQIELHDQIAGPANRVALFTGNDSLPFSGSQLDTLLHHMLCRTYPAQTAKLYSWHSARIWLACALLASNASRAQIQAVCRWQTEDSLNIYACLGASQYADILSKAMSVRIDAARANSLADAVPFIDISDVRRAQHAADDIGRAAERLDDAPCADDDADQD